MIPVDIYVPGCAARPESIIDGVVKAIAMFKDKVSKVSPSLLISNVCII